MSEIEWLPRGLEQDAPPISQPLPTPERLWYRVGGTRVVRDYSGAHFDPHFWLYIKATAIWRMGYDHSQRPTYEVAAYRDQVFHVLLIDYWKPPIEAERTDQYTTTEKQSQPSRDAIPYAPIFTDAGITGQPSFTEPNITTIPTFTAG